MSWYNYLYGVMDDGTCAYRIQFLRPWYGNTRLRWTIGYQVKP